MHNLLSSLCSELIYLINQGKLNEYKINNYLNKSILYHKTENTP